MGQTFPDSTWEAEARSNAQNAAKYFKSEVKPSDWFFQETPSDNNFPPMVAKIIRPDGKEINYKVSTPPGERETVSVTISANN